MIVLLGATIQPWMLAAAAAVLLAGMLLLFLGTRRRTRAEDAAEVADGVDAGAPEAAADRARTAEAGTGQPAASDPDPKV